MPEIAEVALTAEILNDNLKGKKLIAMDFVDGRYARKNPNGFDGFMDNLPLIVDKVDSRGKFLWFELHDPLNKKNIWYIWNTFGLYGMWSFFDPKYKRAVLSFNDDIIVYYSDMLNFGTFKFSQDKTLLDKKLKGLSPDFLKDSDFSLAKIKKYKIPIAKILTDQKKIGSGIGNYLIAEILYRAKISPHRLGNSLTKKELDDLKYWIKYVIKLSYQDNHIGYMVNLNDMLKKHKKRDYHPDIKLNESQFKFLVYRQKKDPLGNDVVVEKMNNRSMYWVPQVQK